MWRQQRSSQKERGTRRREASKPPRSLLRKELPEDAVVVGQGGREGFELPGVEGKWQEVDEVAAVGTHRLGELPGTYGHAEHRLDRFFVSLPADHDDLVAVKRMRCSGGDLLLKRSLDALALEAVVWFLECLTWADCSVSFETLVLTLSKGLMTLQSCCVLM